MAGLESFTTIAPSIGTDQSLDLSKNWLRGCDYDYSHCQNNVPRHSQLLPTRLIDIGTEESVITPRICLNKDIATNAVYFPLSHCWGHVRPGPMLLQSNVEHLLRGINFSRLSNTFQHALRVVRYLGR